MSSGAIALLILGFCILLFLTNWIPSVVVACIGCAMMVLFKVCSFADAFSGFSSSIVILMFSALTVGIAMFDTGAAQLIGKQVIRLSHDNERRFLLTLCIVSGIMAMFMANTAVIAAFFPIIDSVCRMSDKMRRRDFALPLAISVMVGGACTLIGCTPQLTASGILQSTYGFELEMFDMTIPGVCILVLTILYISVFGIKSGKKIWGQAEVIERDLDADRKADINADYDHRKVAVMLIIVVAMVISYVGAWLTTTMTAVLAALLCLITGCTTVKSVIKNMNWDIVVFLAACLGIAEGLNVSGSGNLLSGWISPFLENVNSPFAVYAVMVILVTIISNFVTNSAAIIIVLPIAFSICSVMGYNPLPFCIGITFGASFACSTPLAASQIAMTLVAGYKFSDYLKYTLPLVFIFLIGTLVFVPLCYPLA